MLHAGEDVAAGEARHIRLGRHTGSEHQLLRAQHNLFAIAINDHRPLAGGLVVNRTLDFGLRPVVELHHLGVHLKPVTDLVLR